MKIELRHIHKHFGPVHANNDISLTFGEGRVIGILGENGAGKSTLMKILSGYQPADRGEIRINDRVSSYRGPQAAIAAGIGMLQQDPLDIAAFSVLENFTFGQPGGLRFNRQRHTTQLMELCGRFGFDLAPDTPIAQLSIAQRQQLEIIRLLALGVQTLILDEPTTGISAEQKNLLFDTLRGLAHAEGMTILLVSHKLEDVIALCDEVFVLRAGKLVGNLPMPATKSEIVRLMFGQELTLPEREARDLSGSPEVLALRDVHLQAGRLTVAGVNLMLRQGEVIGLAGLDGSGQELLMRACAGLQRPNQGQVMLVGQDMTGRSYRHFMAAGVIFGAAGRLEEGLIAGLTLTEHMALVFDRHPVINWTQVRSHTEARIQHYNVRGRCEDTIERLSGGNQQRVLMAMLPDKARVLVLEQPTRGLDVDSATWIWEQLLAQRQQGAAILFSSADLDELLRYSDRIIVCYAGRLYAVDDPGSVTVSDLGHYIGGEFEGYNDEPA